VFSFSSNSVISANNVNTFKNRLHRFWANQELIFDYKSSLTGTGNRSFIDSSNIINSFVSLFHITFDGYRALGCHPFCYNFALLYQQVQTDILCATFSCGLHYSIIHSTVFRHALCFHLLSRMLVGHDQVLWQKCSVDQLVTLYRVFVFSYYSVLVQHAANYFTKISFWFKIVTIVYNWQFFVLC